jgi:archaellum component FlaF (FlaF/FlaG flagellin family)
MKGAVDLITLIIVACMVVSIGLMLWFYLNSYYSQVSQTGEARTQRSLETLSSCMRIEEAFQNKFFIRNCGNGVITNNTLNVYVDGELINFNLTPSSIDGGKTGTLIVRSWGLSVGQHALRITNPNFETSTLFEATLPDSCVLALDFDEGSGTMVYDSSPYHNGGNLANASASYTCGVNGACPSWVDGKLGKALYFDGKGDYVDISNSKSLNITKDITIEAWIKSSLNTNSINDMRIIVRKEMNFEFQFYGETQNGLFDMKVQNSSACGYECSSEAVDIPNHAAFTWHHFLGRRKGNLVELYVDGILKGSDSNFLGDIKTSDDDLNIGGTDWGANFNGTIDSVRIYNKALTPDQTLNFRII